MTDWSGSPTRIRVILHCTSDVEYASNTGWGDTGGRDRPPPGGVPTRTGDTMATKDDFTEDEWKTLQRGVTGAGMLVSVADPDFTDSFGESKALAKELREAHDASDSRLVRELAHVHSTGFGLVASPQKVETETLDALQAAVGILAEKAPEDLEPYRQVVKDVASAVANAKDGVSSKEEAAIVQITEALG
jgi:hypothetical protein